MITKWFISFILFALLAFTVYANDLSNKGYDSVLVDEVTSIYDGDTFRVNINSWPGIIGHRIPVRIAAIDTPELRGKCQIEKKLARKAKRFTVSMLRSAKNIEIKNIKRGKYFRIVADVFVDGKSLAKELMNKQFAVEYDGGQRINWCK